MEEDAGKLVHAGSDRLAGSTHSLVDYNRAGVALARSSASRIYAPAVRQPNTPPRFAGSCVISVFLTETCRRAPCAVT